jgi:hypothetical protein
MIGSALVYAAPLMRKRGHDGLRRLRMQSSAPAGLFICL